MVFAVPWLYMTRRIPLPIFMTSMMVRETMGDNTRYADIRSVESTVITLADWYVV
jgi:hypothetical protein